LKIIAVTIKNTVRRSDVICRLGGEEFAAILPATDQPGIHRVAEKIRAAVCELDLTDIIDDYPLSVTIGVSDLGDHDMTNAIKRADKALYQAKEKGRNRVDSLFSQYDTVDNALLI